MSCCFLINYFVGENRCDDINLASNEIFYRKLRALTALNILPPACCHELFTLNNPILSPFLWMSSFGLLMISVPCLSVNPFCTDFIPEELSDNEGRLLLKTSILRSCCALESSLMSLLTLITPGSYIYLSIGLITSCCSMSIISIEKNYVNFLIKKHTKDFIIELPSLDTFQIISLSKGNE